jgi:hypothetical protein
LEQSEQWCKELGWSQRLAWIIYGRADIFIQQGKNDDAETLLRTSLSLATTWNAPGLLAYNTYALARLYNNTHRWSLARQYAEEAYNVFERLGWAKELAEVEELLLALDEKEG